jgi:hypothetical protein
MGKIVLEVMSENLFASKDVIGKKVMEKMQPRHDEILDLRAELFTPNVNHKALKRIENGQSVEWDKLLGTNALEGMRRKAEGQQSLAPSRQLGVTMPFVGKAPADTAESLTLGILSTIAISAGEIMLHIEMWWPGFALPGWAWDVMFQSGALMGVTSCKLGTSFWCNFALGALGLNLIDALFVLICGQTAEKDSWLQKKCKSDFFVVKKMKALVKALPR